jgi:hypothetical protein
MRHKLTEKEEAKGGRDSAHHHKMARHHHAEMKKHIDHLHKMAKEKHPEVTAHDRAVDRKNLSRARSGRGK